MNVELKRIGVGEMLVHGAFEADELGAMIRYAQMSDPLLMGTYKGDLLAFLGLIPPSLLADEAYAWLWTTPALDQHRVIFGLLAKRFIRMVHHRYSAIYGHCSRYSWKWPYSLGAEIVEVNGDVFKYVIRT